MAATLELNTPQRVVLSTTAGNVAHVLVPAGTTFLSIGSEQTFFLDYGSAGDGAAGTPSAQMRYRPGTANVNIPDTTSQTTYRVAGSITSQAIYVMARGPSTDEAVEEETTEATEAFSAAILRWLPPYYESVSPLLGGPAGAMGTMQGVVPTLIDLTTIELGTGKWLTLHARGLGKDRATDETDAELRTRLRQIEDSVTPQAILAAVNALLTSVTTETATLTEWFEGPGLADDGSPSDSVLSAGAPFHLDNEDQAVLVGGPQSFVITVPRLSGAFTEQIYFTIIAAVERLRPHGTRWRLRLAAA